MSLTSLQRAHAPACLFARCWERGEEGRLRFLLWRLPGESFPPVSASLTPPITNAPLPLRAFPFSHAVMARGLLMLALTMAVWWTAMRW